GMSSGGDREDLCPDRAPGTHVVRRVADYEQAALLELRAEVLRASQSAPSDEEIALLRVAAEATEAEELEHPAPRELDLRAAADVAGSESDREAFVIGATHDRFGAAEHLISRRASDLVREHLEVVRERAIDRR